MVKSERKFLKEKENDATGGTLVFNNFDNDAYGRDHSLLMETTPST